MAGCLYAVNGKWLTESQFKKILNDGLLDQLIVNQQFKMPEAFKPDPEIIAKHSGEVETGPVKLKVVRKINSNKMINNQVDINKAEEGQTLGYSTRPSRRSPRTVIEESNKQIEQENKRLGLTRSPNRMWFVTKVGGKIQYGGLNKALIKEMTANKATNLEEKLEEGIVYMLVPSAKGLYPMRLRTSFFGETKKASEGKKIIRELFKLEGKEFTARKKDLTKYLYKTNFKKKKDGTIEVQAERAGGQVEKFTFATPEEMINYVVGDYTDGQVNLSPEGKPGSRGLIAKVDHFKLNKKTKSPEALGNLFYADQGFLTTDLYTEGGNFFSNSSFIIEAYQATGKDLEVLQAVMEGDMPATTEEAEAEAVENQVTTPEVPNQQSKKDEAPINDKTMQEVNEMRIITLPIENSNQVYRIYVEPKGNTLEMTKIQIGTMKKGKNANDVFQPTREIKGTEAGTVRTAAKEKFDNLLKEFNARHEVEPEGGVHQDPPSPADVGTGLFDFPIIPEEGMVEDENTPTTPNYGFGEQTGGEDLDLNPRTRTTSKKVDATKMTAQEQRDLLRKKLGDNTMEGHFSIFNTLEDLEKYLPEETYQILLEARKNGEYLHGIFTEAAVHLSENAADGTGFHEAFHVIFRLGLNLEQRLQLLEEVIDMYPDQTTPSSTLIDLEEILADEYMDYALSDEALNLPPSSHIGRWFKGIYRTINMFYSKNPKISVHRIFEDIQLGVYRNRLTFENTDFSKISPEAVRLKTEKPVYVDPRFEEEIFQFVEYKMFQLIDKAREAMHSKERPTKHLSDSEMINLITQKNGIRSLYGMVLYNISTDMNTNAAKGKDVSGLQQVLKYFTDEMKAVEMAEVGGKMVPIYSGKPPAIVERFNRYLRHRDININIDAIEDFSPNLDEETSFDEDFEEGTAEERWQKAYIEINPQTTLSQTVRRRMGTIPKLVNVDGEQQPVRNSLGAPITYSEAEVFGYLGQKITDSYNPTDMVQKLMDLREDKPFVNQILNFIEKDVNFKTSLYTTLASKTFQKFLMIYEEKGNYTWFYSNRKTVDNLIKENLIADFIVEDNDLFEKHGDAHTLKGQRNYNKPKLSKVSEEIVKLGNLRERAQKTTKPEELRKIVKDFSDFLTSNNIFVTPQQLTDIWNPSKEFSQTKWDNIIGVMNKANAVFMQMANGKNPFLVLRPDSEDGFKAPLQEFVEALKPGMEKEVIAAFRNGDNKTVYAIQFSNHLTKMMQILKDPEKFKQYLEENKNDPVLMSMPMIQEIRDGEMDPAELEVVLFDSLARKGKHKSVPYSELSDIEMEAMAMAAFHKSGNAQYGYYKMPTPSDGSILPLIKGKKLGYEEILDNLLTVALGEVKRMREWDMLPQDSQLRLIANYKDKASSFQILSFLNGRVDMTSPTLDMDIKAAIEDYLQNDFLELHKSQWKRAGIILDYEAGPNGNIKFADNVITKSKQGKEVEFFKEYLYNQYYMNTQMTTIFAGDPAYYKNTVDYQKRYKQIISPGMLTNSELVDEEYHGVVFNDEEVPSAPEVIQDMIKLIDNSKLPAAKKKELKARVASQLHNVTDAATFISLDRAIAKLVSMGRFTPQHQAAAERIRQGIERNSDAALFQVDKPFMFTKVNVDGRQVPVQLKNSEVLLTKSFAERTDKDGNYLYPKLVEVYRMLNEAKEDEPYLSFVAFESAVKVGAPGTSVDEKGRVRYNELVEGSDGSYSLNAEPTILTFKHEDWRLQQETPEHYIDEAGNYGSQIRHLIVGDMDMDGVYMVNGKPYRGSEVAQMYQELIVENIKESYENVRAMFENEDGSINYERIVSHLKEEMKRRNLDEEYFKAIELIDAVGRTGKTTALPLWHPLISYKVESLLNSFFKNTITKQKIKGGNMVNATSYGVSHTLEMYMDENGNYQMEALLPWWSRKFFPKNEEGEIDVEAIPPILSKLIGYRIPTEDKYSMFNIKVVGFTDPAAGGTIILPVEATTQAGLDFDIDKLFMIVPEWRRVRNPKTGESEIQYRNYITQDSTPSEVASAIFDSQTKFEDFVEKYVPKEHRTRILNAKETADEEIFLSIKARGQFKSQNEFNKAVKDRKRLKALLKKEKNASVRRGIKQELDHTFELGKELDTFDGGVEIAYNAYNELKEEIEGFVKDHVDPTNYEAEFNSTATRNNRILEIMRGIMENENTALSIMDGGNFDHLKELGNKTRLLQIPANADASTLKLKREAKKALKQFREGKLSVEDYRKKLNELTEQLDNIDFNINLPATQLTLFRRNMTGKQLIGVFANHNTHHAKAQHTNLKLKNPITLAGKSYEMLNQIYDETGYRISKSLAIKLAAVVDNAKDPISSHLNMNSYTAHLIAMLSRLGVNEDTIFAFVNQPVIVEITNRYFNERGSLSEQKEMISAIARDWQNKMAQEKIDLEELEKEGYDTSLEEMEDALDRNGSKAYHKTQYKVLQKFMELDPIAEELRRGVSASRVDTQGVGPSFAENYVMMDKQQRLLNQPKEDSYIENMSEMFFADSGQLINPAFNEFAWIKPITVMNKIHPTIGVYNNIERTIIYSLLGRVKNFFSTLKGKNGLTATEARNIDVAFMGYLGSALPFFEQKQAKDILEKVPERLREFKNKYPGSIYMPFLESLYVKDADRSVKLRRIEYYNTGKGPLEASNSRRLWLQMFHSSDAETRKLAFDLVKYSYFSNGMMFGPHTFINMVPVEFWTTDFAKNPANADMGLTMPNGDSMNEVMDKQLKNLDKAIFMNNGYLNVKAKGPIYNFIKQYVQNFAEKTAIVPHIKLNEGSREFTPDTVTTLKENQVYVFPTTEEGAHNEGAAGFAFSGNSTKDSAAHAVGKKGRWTEYGKTGQVTEGTQGKGFGLRMRTTTIENGVVGATRGIKTLEKAERQRLLGYFKKDLETLMEIAEENDGLEYVVDHLNKNTGWSTKEVRDILIQINDSIGIPNNVVLPRYLEVRNKKGTFIESKTVKGPDGKERKVEILGIGKKANQFKAIEPGIFPSFFKVTHNGTVKLFEIDQSSITKGYLYYKRIPILGTSNFVKQFSYDSEISKSIVPELTVKTAKDKPTSLDELHAMAPPVTSDDPSLFSMKANTAEKVTKEKEEEALEDPLGAADLTAQNIPVEKFLPTSTEGETKPISFTMYEQMAKSKGQEVMKKAEWETMPPVHQQGIMDYLKTC